MWRAYVDGVTWARNLFVFFTVITAIGSLMALSKDAQADATRAGRSIPAWANRTVDGILILGCAATGHFFLATLWIWSALAEGVLYSGYDNKTKAPV